MNDYGDFYVTNTTGWLCKRIVFGDRCKISFNWFSAASKYKLSNYPGKVRIVVNDKLKEVYEIQQGDVEIEIGSYTSPNTISNFRIIVTDWYHNSLMLYFSISTKESD